MADVAHMDNSSKFVTGGDLGNGIPNVVIFVVIWWFFWGYIMTICHGYFLAM